MFSDKYFNLEKLTKEDLFTKMCLEERGALQQSSANMYLKSPNEALEKSPYYNQIAQLSLGQMTVYRMRLECKCELLKQGEQCTKILNNAKDQFWSSYMGKLGDGFFKSH